MAEIISFLAILIAIASYLRTRSLNFQQLELQRSISNLARKHLDNLISQGSRKGHSYLDIQLEPHDVGYQFLITNVGNSPTQDIELEVEPRGGGDNPLVQSDYKSKFPVPILQPGQAIGVLASINRSSATAFMVKLRWKDLSDEPVEIETFLSI